MIISINNTTFTQYDVTGLNDNTLHHMHIMLLLLLVIMTVVRSSSATSMYVNQD